MTTSSIGLADAIENLRQELTEATKRGEGKSPTRNISN